MPHTQKPETPASSSAEDEVIETLLAAQVIALRDEDRASVLPLARYMREQAALIAGPLPMATEPVTLHSLWLLERAAELWK